MYMISSKTLSKWWKIRKLKLWGMNCSLIFHWFIFFGNEWTWPYLRSKATRRRDLAVRKRGSMICPVGAFNAAWRRDFNAGQRYEQLMLLLQVNKTEEIEAWERERKEKKISLQNIYPTTICTTIKNRQL